MRQRNKKRKTGLKLILLVVLVMFGILSVSKKKAEKEERELYAKKEALIAKNLSEDDRTIDLNEEKAERQTLGYVEKIAREVLGMVKPDDIILREETPDDTSGDKE